MIQNLQVEPEIRRALNGFTSALSSAGASVCQMPAVDSSAADMEEDPPYRLPTTEAEVEATVARIRTWRSNPNLPPLGAHVKMPAGPYDQMR